MKFHNITVLQNQLNQIESYLPQSEVTNGNVSKAKVSWHLDHSLKVINSVVTNMKNSDPTLYRKNFSLLGKFFFKLKFFPRGKAKAPKYVLPPEVILKEDIILQIEEARENIETISSLNENAHFKHPLFGDVNTSRVLRFLETHTNHHLKIVKSILK